MIIMKNILKYIGTILLIAVLYWQLINSFSKVEYVTSLDATLQSAGDRKSEFERVLSHYKKNPADSLKYKAACFLIENMPFYYYSTSKQLENYKTYYALLKKRKDKTPQQVADSIKNVYGPIKDVVKKRDIMEIDSAYLCHSIDWAFKVWQEQPWGKNVTFETFCNYILPYRIGNEPLTYWRESYYEKYNSLLDSLRMSDTLDKYDPVVAANYLINKLPDKEHYYTSVAPYYFGHLGPEYVQYLTGTCTEAADFGIYLFRALGIPCTIDFIPVCGTSNAGHAWIATRDKNGEEYMTDFPNELRPVRKNGWYGWDTSAKVYRSTYQVNQNLYKQMAKYGEVVYPFWSLPKFNDITYDYVCNFKKELTVPLDKLYKDKRKCKIAYLCVSRREQWIPVDWTEYDANHLTFSYVRTGSIMRVATYENAKLHFLTDPFYVDKQTYEAHYYSGRNSTQDVVLYAKCNIDDENDFRNRMIGGVFEGSDSADFEQKDTVYIIQSKPNRLKTTVKAWSDKEFRYIRYISPHEGYCNVAEISFYKNNDSIPLSGKVIGVSGHDSNHEMNNVFDGKTWTSFVASEKNGGWVGLDLGHKARIDRIVYTPRNRDNYIRQGDVFELFYCDRDWKSAGIVKASSDSLVYRNIPLNSLLFLRNHTRGVDERIFVYENGTQIWK